MTLIPSKSDVGWQDALLATAGSVVTELPRHASEPAGQWSSDADADRSQRFAAIVSAYHGSAPPSGDPNASVVFGWRRIATGGPVELLVAGPDTTLDHSALLTLPPGGRGRRLEPGELWRRLTTVPWWTRLSAMPEPLAADDPLASSALRPSLEDCLLRAWQGPFAWFVVAQPVPRAGIAALTADAAFQARQASSRAGSSQEHAVELVRWEQRHRELRQAESTGLWQIHLFAGGTSAPSALRVSGLLAASLDLAGLPYVIAPGSVAGPLQQELHGPVGVEAQLHGSTHLLTAIARSPVNEIPGIRLTLPSEFDVTPEFAEPAGADTLRLGTVLDRDRSPAGALHLPFSSLNRHTFVCGATGAGKSQTIRWLLEEATRQGLPWMVIEPAKAEYRLMGARLRETAQVIAIRPGDPDALPAGINPLQPAPGFALQTHLDMVRALFLAAFDADEPFPQVLGAALTRAYEELGWDLALGEPREASHQPPYPTLADLQRTAEQVVDEIGYGKEVADNVRGFVRVRLSSLRLGTTGRFFEGGHPIDFGTLLKCNVVFEIEDVGDDRDKAFLMGTVLIRLVEHLRVAERNRPAGEPVRLRHLSVFEEAHRLLRRSDHPGPAAHAVEMFGGLLAEIRAYGEGLVIADQIPSKLLTDVIKNTAVKVVHRLPAEDDRAAVGATMNLTDAQSRYLVTLAPGTAAVFADGMDHPILTTMPNGSGSEAGSSPIVSPAEVLTPRSSACGSHCFGNSGCSLREMTVARRELERSPAVVLWAELAVVAHLVGWPVPTLRDGTAAALRALPARLRDCELGQVVDAAVASRATVLVSSMTPADLAQHVAAELRAQLESRTTCADEEPEWLAGHFRWNLVRRALHELDRADPRAGRHPLSDRWARSYGRAIPGTSCRAQLAKVDSWRVAELRSLSTVETFLFGGARKSELEAAVGTDRATADWQAKLATALGCFEVGPWPLAYLAAVASASNNPRLHSLS